MGWTEWERTGDETKLSLKLAQTTLKWEFIKNPHVCFGETGEIINLDKNPSLVCNRSPDCRLGADESLEDAQGEQIHGCPFYVNPKF